MPAEELVGRTIAGKFVIEAFVGGGGMGAVYRAKQIGLDKIVAIKVLHPELSAESAFTARFKREARAASRINHPNSMRVVDFGEEPDGLLYIAMEYLEGKVLRRIIDEEAPLAPARIVNLLRQALAALAAAHDLHIIHRDLKPENIIVLQKTDDEGHVTELVKVCDFGIAKFATPSVTTGEKLTAQGTIIGTPYYLSPEQARSDAIDTRSDLYSMGVILYEALTGRLPFTAETPLAIVLKHLNDNPPPPSTLHPNVDRWLEAVCLKAMAKKPDDRYATAREMRVGLAVDASAKRAEPEASPVRPKDPAPAPAHGLVLIAEATSVPGVSAPKGFPAPRGRSALEMVASVPPPPPGRTLRVVAAIGIVVALAGGAVLIHRHRLPASAAIAAMSPEPAPVPSGAPTSQVVAPPPDQEPPQPSEPATASAAPSIAAEAPSTKPVPSAQPGRGGRARADAKATAAAAAPTPSPAETPAPPPPAAPPGSAPTPLMRANAPPSTAHVVASSVTCAQMSTNDIRSALPLTAFTLCYRDAFPGSVPPSGVAGLDLEISSSHTEAMLSVSDNLAAVAHCVASAAKGIVVRNVPATGTVTAHVDLTFKPE